MKVATAVYTLASVAVLALIIMRPPVEVASPSAAPAAAQATEAAPEATAPEAAAPTADKTTPEAQTTTVAPEPTAATPEPEPAAATPEPEPATATPEPEPTAATPEPEPAAATPEPEPAAATPEPEPAAATPEPEPAAATPEPVSMPPSSSEEKKNDVAPTAATKPAPNPKAVPDYVREQSMANEINGTLTNGEIVTLSDGTQSFMGILTPAEHPRGAVIILPGCGLPPDGENVTHPLRTGLAAKGWTTLSLQMPVLAKEAKYYDYVPLFANADKRIDAGIALLKQKGIAPVVLAAHDCGAHMAMNWLGNKGDGEIAAYVGLGMGATDAGQEMVQPLPLDKMKIPVLDIYGEKDTPQVISLAPERQALLQKGGNTHSKQMVLPEADHDFKNKGDALSAVVATWLNSLPL
ncbi:DUF3530 family protein [Thiothrix litoralis]|uniref:DUF3530 family protein n=1 Tax=Thiothrix litoralis TaxID=2891210 RepID=A0ABX7WNA7_9GAMM|nr:DUF3530 family protein [Thiothrix litoralis]QTR45264.1 DUF3530 family protein [Thiothrix litoralis]